MHEKEWVPRPAENTANKRNRLENEFCTVEFVVTTPELVSRLLDGNIRNRKVTDSHLKKLTMDFSNGRYVFNGATIVRDRSGYLLDGQHRLLAIKEAGYPQVPILLVTLNCDRSKSELAYDRMDCNKSRTYAQRLEHKGIDKFRAVAAIRRKITYFKTNFNSYPVVSDAVYDDVGGLYHYEIEKVAPLVGNGFTADMAAACCLVGKATGCIDDCVAIIKKAKAGEMLKIGTCEHTLMKLFSKTLHVSYTKTGRNSFQFAAVANGLIAALSGEKYAAVNSDSVRACRWISNMAKENDVRLLPKALTDLNMLGGGE